MFRLQFRLLPDLLFIACAGLICACRSPQIATDITVTLNADGLSRPIEIPAGSTALEALEQAGITPGEMDRSDPPFYTVLNNEDSISLTRVEEVFDTEQLIIPYERQIIRNETLPEGETRLVQAGVNGLQ